jgi:nickel/cobalt transporter (NicO) family protein
MNETTLLALLATAATLAVVHTAIGVDHSLPFVVIGRARGWSLSKTLGVTGLCGLGHVASSVLIGAVGIPLGLALERLEAFEGLRGSLASWALMAFGLTYAVWGVGKALKGRRHEHVHVHADTVHKHPHDHAGAHAHPHGETASVTTWWLFVVFALGPCEALIPLLAAPAADHDMAAGVLVALVFGGATLATMLALVAAGYAGLRMVSMKPLERWSHALAGAAVVISGVAIQALGI